MSLVKIIFDPVKKETHAIFKHIDRERAYIPVGYLTDKKEFIVTDYRPFLDEIEVKKIIHRYARVSDTDNYDKYIGAAMVIAEEYAGSKAQLKRDFEFYKQAIRSKVEWDALCTGLKQRSYYKNIEEYAYYVRMPKIYKTLEKFRAYVDKYAVEKKSKGE